MERTQEKTVQDRHSTQTIILLSTLYSHVVKCIGLAWTESTFPIAALVVLCFVFVARTVLITYQCFGYC